MAGLGHKALLAGGLIQTVQVCDVGNAKMPRHKALLAGGLIQTYLARSRFMKTYFVTKPF